MLLTFCRTLTSTLIYILDTYYVNRVLQLLLFFWLVSESHNICYHNQNQ